MNPYDDNEMAQQDEAATKRAQAEWMNSGARFVAVRISPTISNEYASRNPEDIPESCYCTGRVSVSVEAARLMLADAEFNSNTKAFTVGEYGMPLPTFNAYRALAKQLRKVLA